jgi:hypothetical protein
MEKKLFLNVMQEALGHPVEEAMVPAVHLAEPIPEEKQEMVPVHIMDSDMADTFYLIGVKDLIDFVKKFKENEYCYKVGGIFGSDAKTVNEGKRMWVEAFNDKAKPGKKSKAAYYVDATDPVDSINEVLSKLRIEYPDLIIGF